MEIFKASKQWSERPNDERFWGPADAAEACEEYQRTAVQAPVRYADLRVEADGGELNLMGKESQPARLTHYAFGQVAARAGAPADFLRRLPATLAAQNLNHCLKSRGSTDPDSRAKLLLHRNGNMLARCLTGPDYVRIWNGEIFRRLVGMQEDGWKVPPARPARTDPRARPATAEDLVGGTGGAQVKIGDMIAPAGCYASDRDMFAFMVRVDSALRNPLDDETPLLRGFIVWNSEVGDRSFGVQTFLLDGVCGNHIIWGARDLTELRIVHVGKARDRAFGELRAKLVRYANDSATDDNAKIASAQSYRLGDTKDEVLDLLLGMAKRRTAMRALSKGTVLDAYTLAEATPRYGDPRTAWGMAQGLTEISQRQKHAADRVRIDRAAGDLLTVAF